MSDHQTLCNNNTQHKDIHEETVSLTLHLSELESNRTNTHYNEMHLKILKNDFKKRTFSVVYSYRGKNLTAFLFKTLMEEMEKLRIYLKSMRVL